jgi:hypothetical protein
MHRNRSARTGCNDSKQKTPPRERGNRRFVQVVYTTVLHRFTLRINDE